MKFFTAFIFTIISATTLQAQYNKKAVQAYNKALENLQYGSYKEAIPDLLKAIQLDAKYPAPVIDISTAYNQIKDYNNAVSYFEKAYQLDSNAAKIYAGYYAQSLAGIGRFSDALNAVNRFLAIPNLSNRSRTERETQKKNYEFAVQYELNNTHKNYVFAPQNLGDSVNTSLSEYYPSITINDSLLVFTRRQANRAEDFIESTITKDKFSSAKKIDGTLNEEPFKGAINISQDGEWLVFAGDFGYGKGYGNFDLFISYWTPQGWSEPENLGPNINTEYYETAPSLSPDKKALYFTSRRPDSYGGMDLYVSYNNGRGWEPAINMGPNFNTTGDDAYPFIHADNQSLYFTSNGLPGYGGTDLFVAKKNIDGKWNTPVNLGYPINTIENEGSFFVTAEGSTAYYASDRSDSRGGLDIYKFELREDIRPLKTLYVQGRVYDVKTSKGLPSKVSLIDNNDNTTVSQLQTDEKGNFFITLPTGKDYTFTVDRKGYLFYTTVYALSNNKADSIYKKDIPLTPIEINKSITLKNIQFEHNSYKLMPVSLIELGKLVQMLNENNTIKIEIAGHTDNTGKPADNLLLSKNRAKAVSDYLISKNIAAARITHKGFGETKPIAENTTAEGRAANRRTEFKIVGL